MITTAYRCVRPALPWKEVEIEGFRFDRRFKVVDTCHETYESATRRFMREYLAPDDELLVVGGGTGITSITASPHIARVTAIEADAPTRERFIHHLDRNGVACVDVHLGWVGDANDPNRPSDVDVFELEGHTAMEIDVEGNGLPIVPRIPDTVETVFFESHPTMGVSTFDAIERLRTHGFRIIDRRTEWPATGGEIILGVR